MQIIDIGIPIGRIYAYKNTSKRLLINLEYYICN